MDGLCAISAPIFDCDGKVHYCLTITLTPFRLQAKGRDKLVDAVKKSAHEISHQVRHECFTAGKRQRKNSRRNRRTPALRKYIL
jgi:hypothetical protein